MLRLVFLSGIDPSLVIKCLEMANLLNFVLSLEGGIEFTVGAGGSNLSGGQKQRIGIARAIYQGRELIVFDESTSALDFFVESEIIETLVKLKSYASVVLILTRNLI